MSCAGGEARVKIPSHTTAEIPERVDNHWSTKRPRRLIKLPPQLGTRRKLFQKGQANPGSKALRAKTGAGRRKGVRNRMTRDLKELILDSLEGIGGQQWLERLGRTEKKAFATLIGKLIPLQVHGMSGVDPEDQARKVREKLAAIEATTESATTNTPDDSLSKAPTSR
jgi:hypothetical protein